MVNSLLFSENNIGQLQRKFSMIKLNAGKTVGFLETDPCDALVDPSSIYASEFNKPELSDRVLVLDIIKDGWSPMTWQTPRGENNAKDLMRELDCVDCFKDNEASPTADVGYVSTRTSTRTSSGRKRSSLDHQWSCETRKKKKSIATKSSNNVTTAQSSGSIAEATENQKDVPPTSPSCSVNGFAGNSTVLRERRVFIHCSWLALHSKFFRALFYGGMLESRTNEVHLKVEESEEEAHLLLLQAIYQPVIFRSITVDEALGLLELADKYDVPIILKKTIEALLKEMTHLSTCKKVYQVIRVKHIMNNVDTLEQMVRKTLAYKFSPLDTHWQSVHFLKLSLPLLKMLLTDNNLSTQSENTVFQALMYWIDVNAYDVSEDDPLSPLLSVVRFELLSIDFLVNTVQNHPLATTMIRFKELYLQGISYRALTPDLRRSLDAGSLPEQRSGCDRDIIQHSWVIDEDLWAKVQAGAEVKSKVIWCCGYQFQMAMKKSSTDEALFSGKVYLRAVGLKKQSAVPLTWSVSMGGFLMRKPRKQQATFTATSPMHGSSVEFSLLDESEMPLSIGLAVKLR